MNVATCCQSGSNASTIKQKLPTRSPRLLSSFEIIDQWSFRNVQSRGQRKPSGLSANALLRESLRETLRVQVAIPCEGEALMVFVRFEAYDAHEGQLWAENNSGLGQNSLLAALGKEMLTQLPIREHGTIIAADLVYKDHVILSSSDSLLRSRCSPVDCQEPNHSFP